MIEVTQTPFHQLMEHHHIQSKQAASWQLQQHTNGLLATAMDPHSAKMTTIFANFNPSQMLVGEVEMVNDHTLVAGMTLITPTGSIQLRYRYRVTEVSHRLEVIHLQDDGYNVVLHEMEIPIDDLF